MNYRTVIFVTWAAAVSTVMVVISARHLAPIKPPLHAPKPPADTQADSSQQIAGIRITAAPEWRIQHVMVEGCPCSATVAGHLVRRRPIAGVLEQVLTVRGNITPDWIAQLEAASYPVLRLSADELYARTGVHGGPWLLATRPDGTIAYSGGYSPTRPGTSGDRALQDRQIVARLRAGESVEPLAAFGCSLPDPTTAKPTQSTTFSMFPSRPAAAINSSK